MTTTPAERIAKVDAPNAPLSNKVIEALDAELDDRRVKTKPGGGSKRYLAEHDVIRTANRIFGYGNWGTEVVSNDCIGVEKVTNSKGEEGWYVGYRCTVRLSVRGCLPVDGCGYGDAFEKQWSAAITAHELAYKEAESDAIKRAFKKWGDQFGLILYAKAEDLSRIQEEKEYEVLEAPASEGEIAEMLSVARAKGKESSASEYIETKVAADGVFKHRHFLAMMNRLDRLPDASDGDKEAERKPIIAAWESEGDRPATDAEIDDVLELAGKVGDDTRSLTADSIEKHQAKFHGLTSSKWLSKVTDKLLELAKNEFVPPDGQQTTIDGAEPTTDEVERAYA